MMILGFPADAISLFLCSVSRHAYWNIYLRPYLSTLGRSLKLVSLSFSTGNLLSLVCAQFKRLATSSSSSSCCCCYPPHFESATLQKVTPVLIQPALAVYIESRTAREHLASFWERFTKVDLTNKRGKRIGESRSSWKRWKPSPHLANRKKLTFTCSRCCYCRRRCSHFQELSLK